VRRESVYGVLAFAFAEPPGIRGYRWRKDSADTGRTGGGSAKKNSVAVVLRKTPFGLKMRLILSQVAV